MEEGGTYLEDYLLSLELLPNDMRRDFELIKELDKECIDLNRELTELENSFIDSQVILKKRTFDAPDEAPNADTQALIKSSQQFVDRINNLRVLTRQKLAEKTAIAVNMGNIIDRFSRKLDTDLAFFETDLKGCGEFETSRGAEPGSEVAFSVSPDVPVLVSGFSRSVSSSSSSSSSNNNNNNNSINNNISTVQTQPTESAPDSIAEKSMILGRVINYRADTGEYDILDVDDSKKYTLPERQVVVLDLQESQRKLCKGETVFALYPDTTSFYPAVVSNAPRRTAMGAEPTVIVQFSGDEDASGIRPDRVILLKYVVRMMEQQKYTGSLSRGNSNSSLINM